MLKQMTLSHRCLLSGLVYLLSAFLSVNTQAQVTLEKLWTTDGLKIPESVYFYKEGRSTFLFVSQIDGQAAAADGVGGIAKMTVNGNLFSADWVTGLDAPKGMGVYKGNLYVADIDKIVVINIKKGVVEKSYRVAGAKFLNDVAIDYKGDIYVSDTLANKVFRVREETVETYIDHIESANGLALVGKNLIVGSGTKLLLIDQNKNRLPLATGFAQAIDGVEPIGRGDFLVSCWAGLLYYVHLDGKIDLLLDTQKEKMNTADIGFDADSNTLYVPNFLNNTVTAFKVNLP